MSADKPLKYFRFLHLSRKIGKLANVVSYLAHFEIAVRGLLLVVQYHPHSFINLSPSRPVQASGQRQVLVKFIAESLCSPSLFSSTYAR